MNIWKLVAIIFIVLFVLETAVVVWIWKIGTDMIANENTCMVNVCKDYTSYYYDDSTKVCYCYKNGVVEYQEYLK